MAAPQVASCTTVIERLNGVAFGETATGRISPHLPARPFLTGRNRSLRRQNSSLPGALQEIKDDCDADPGKLLMYKHGNREFRIARVSFEDKTHADPVDATTSDGHIHRFLRELNVGEERWVMSRYLPAPGNTKLYQVHYCVFEPEQLPAKRRETLNQSILSLHDKSTSSDQASVAQSA